MGVYGHGADIHGHSMETQGCDVEAYGCVKNLSICRRKVHGISEYEWYWRVGEQLQHGDAWLSHGSTYSWCGDDQSIREDVLLRHR